MFHMITLKQMFVNNSLQKFLSLTAAVSNRIDSIRNLFIIFALDFPALENPILEKRTAVFSHPPIRPMPHPHLQTNPDYWLLELGELAVLPPHHLPVQ